MLKALRVGSSSGALLQIYLGLGNASSLWQCSCSGTSLCHPSCPQSLTSPIPHVPTVHCHRPAVHRGGSHQGGPGRERWAPQLLCLCCRVSSKSLFSFVEFMGGRRDGRKALPWGHRALAGVKMQFDVTSPCTRRGHSGGFLRHWILSGTVCAPSRGLPGRARSSSPHS